MKINIQIEMSRHSPNIEQIIGFLWIDGYPVKIDHKGRFMMHSAENFEAFWLDVTRVVRNMAFLKAGGEIE